MSPSEIAARFAAFTWYTNCRQAPNKTVQAEARRFSEDNWKTFLPLANQGLGRLLLQVAKSRKARPRRSVSVKPAPRAVGGRNTLTISV
jgi:hypothetical protein